MVFNSLEFLAFYVAVTPLFFVFRGVWRTLFLLVASCGFYAAAYPLYLFVLFALIGIDYFAGRVLEKTEGGATPKRKLLLFVSLVANLSVLFIFKYYDFFAQSYVDLARFAGYSLAAPKLGWMLPVGLSFHTFQSMAYVIEVYRRSVKSEQNLIRYAVYVLFYPQLVAGPIERPAHFLPQIARDSSAPRGDQIWSGLQLLAWGMFKKVVVADRLAETADFVFTEMAKVVPGQMSSDHKMNAAALWIGALSFSIQIYCDFSGYSDMARGIARTMGYELMRNFNFPYFARSGTDFWRRWHISLSSWFRDYVYIPLGGARVTPARGLFNLWAVFLLSGLWHGANWTFIAWGAVHAAWVTLERVGSRTPLWSGAAPARAGVETLKWLATFLVVVIAWVFFRAASVTDAVHYIAGMFRLHEIPEGIRLIIVSGKGKAAQYVGWSRFELLLTWGFVAILALAEIQHKKWDHFTPRLKWVAITALLTLTLFGGHFIGRQFIYFQF